MVAYRTMKKCHFRIKIASIYFWNLHVEESESSVFFSEKQKYREILSQMYQIILDKK